MEEAINSTLKDAKKIEEQISAILVALQNEELIQEADLVQLPSADEVSKRVESLKITSHASKLGGGRKGKTAIATSSQIKRKSKEIDSAPIPMEISGHFQADIGARNKNKRKMKDAFKLIESSLFLLPVNDECVLGMTLVNVSGIAQASPDLVLTVTPQEVDVVNKPCKVFRYSAQVNPLDVKYESMENRNIDQGIPFHDTFDPNSAVKKPQIQPGCQVLLSATFQHPLSFMGKSNQVNLISSMMLNGVQLWSRSIPVAADNISLLQANENNFVLHQISILTALGKHKEYFKMNRLLSQGDKSPHKAVEKFLRPIGLEKISSETVGIDTMVDVFGCIRNHLSPLWGSMFKMEKCSRNVNAIRCVVTTRSPQQHDTFLRLFHNWLQKEGRQERNQGISGLTTGPVTSHTEDKHIFTVVQKEINVISDFINYSQKDKTIQMTPEWIDKFKTSVSETDEIFMNYLT